MQLGDLQITLRTGPLPDPAACRSLGPADDFAIGVIVKAEFQPNVPIFFRLTQGGGWQSMLGTTPPADVAAWFWACEPTPLTWTERSREARLAQEHPGLTGGTEWVSTIVKVRDIGFRYVIRKEWEYPRRWYFTLGSSKPFDTLEQAQREAAMLARDFCTQGEEAGGPTRAVVEVTASKGHPVEVPKNGSVRIFLGSGEKLTTGARFDPDDPSSLVVTSVEINGELLNMGSSGTPLSLFSRDSEMFITSWGTREAGSGVYVVVQNIDNQAHLVCAELLERL